MTSMHASPRKYSPVKETIPGQRTVIHDGNSPESDDEDSSPVFHKFSLQQIKIVYYYDDIIY